MAIHDLHHNHPVHGSMKRMEENLDKLKSLGAAGKAQHLWETAGHIWNSAYWVSQHTKDPTIMQEVKDLRLALSQVVSKRGATNTSFDAAIEQIDKSYSTIHGHLY